MKKQARKSFKVLALSLILVADLACPFSIRAESEKEPFLPTWKLLTTEQKQQFIAGYVQGWRDAGKVTDISLEYIRQNPNGAVSALEQIRGLYYDLSSSSSSKMVREIDSYYSKPENRDSSLSMAVSSANSRLK